MFKPKTFSELCAAMQTGARVYVGHTEGWINGIQREDGGGRAWIVTVQPDGVRDVVKEFVRTE